MRSKGIVLCRVTNEKNYKTIAGNYYNKMAEESILMQYGYNVSENDNLTSEHLHGLDDRVVDTRMPHHVAVGEVQADEIVFLRIERLDQLVLHLVGAHLGLKVVGRHLGRSDQNAVFAGEFLLAAAVEEEGHTIFLNSVTKKPKIL